MCLIQYLFSRRSFVTKMNRCLLKFVRLLLLSYFTLLQTSSVVIAFEYCSNLEIQTNHSYHPLRHCQRSNGTIIGLRNVKSIEECVAFAQDRSALAFNYGSKDNQTTNLFDILRTKEMNNSWSWNIHESPEEFYNCQLLECPEYGNFTGMINDTRFDYYSLYTKPPRKESFEVFFFTFFDRYCLNLAPFNSTCISQVGMFVLYAKPSNYTFAYKTCRNLGGGLAHVVSERRTNSLASYLKQNLNLTVSKEV